MSDNVPKPEVEKAILKIAFVLSDFSDSHQSEYRKAFRKVSEKYKWFKPGTSETDAFMQDAIALSKQLADFKRVYSEEEFCEAFFQKIKDDCWKIKGDSDATVRKAFVAWLSVCMADNTLSKQERMLLDKIRDNLNITFSEAFGGLLGALSYGILSPYTDKIKNSSERKAISDDFFSNVLDTLQTIGELSSAMETASPMEQRNLQQSIDILQEQIDSMIQNG